MIRALIIDDELHVREELQELLAESGEYVIAGTCANAHQGLQALKSTRPDVLFLDIHMPQVDGFQFLGMIEAEQMPYVVFVTAHEDFALQAFEEKAVDYLLKPVSAERLARTTEKLKGFLQAGPRVAIPVPALERIPCVIGHGLKLIDAREVEFVRSGESGVHIVTARGEFLTELTLAVLEARTDQLARCHKQFLVNLAQIDEIVRTDATSVVLKTRSGKTVPVSRRFLPQMKDRLLMH